MDKQKRAAAERVACSVASEERCRKKGDETNLNLSSLQTLGVSKTRSIIIGGLED